MPATAEVQDKLQELDYFVRRAVSCSQHTAQVGMLAAWQDRMQCATSGTALPVSLGVLGASVDIHTYYPKCRSCWESGTTLMLLAALILSMGALSVALIDGRVPVFEIVVLSPNLTI